MKYGAIALLSLLSWVVVAQDTTQDDTMKNCPMHDQHQQQPHQSIVQSHGDQAMGFPHDKTTHHFRMLSDGGSIEVTANDPNDKTNVNAIRSHLSRIAIMFGNGDFSAPMFIHDGVPPGITTMQLMKSEISYKYEEVASGGRVRIRSQSAIAVAAIHDFLRFQINEHQTGDRLDVTSPR